MFLTRKYKDGYIHFSTIDNKEKITVQVDNYALPIEVKSERQAKILISRDMSYKMKLVQKF